MQQTDVERQWTYEPHRIPLVSHYIPDFVRLENAMTIEVKGKINSDGRSKLLQIQGALSENYCTVIVKDDMPTHFTSALQAFLDVAETVGVSVKMYTIQRSKFVLAPLLSDSDMRNINEWRPRGVVKSTNVMCGKNLVIWADSNNIHTAPFSYTNLECLKKMVLDK